MTERWGPTDELKLYEPGAVVARWGWHEHSPEFEAQGMTCRWCWESKARERCEFLSLLHARIGNLDGEEKPMTLTVQSVLEECHKVLHDLNERRAIVGLAAATTVEETLIVLLAENAVRLERIAAALERLTRPEAVEEAQAQRALDKREP
jgi:hypothetical protein